MGQPYSLLAAGGGRTFRQLRIESKEMALVAKVKERRDRKEAPVNGYLRAPFLDYSVKPLLERRPADVAPCFKDVTRIIFDSDLCRGVEDLHVTGCVAAMLTLRSHNGYD